MEIAGKYIGSGVNMDNKQLEQALNVLIQNGYTFEDAFAKLMSGVDLRSLRK